MKPFIRSELADDGGLKLIAEISEIKEVRERVRINAQCESIGSNTRTLTVDVRLFEQRHGSSRAIVEQAPLNDRGLT